ncbi:uncharacterized protein LOC142166776 [Nicotiana tabacum]|uniref:Uncharacterized protein LOC142166776 n=1 Tax=Nicotiana tabacum TaxID=4097 RepID=A0AC58SAU4_TOBAC|nr:uncharacterized protein LOC117273983 [Nicotiana tomentosiformis]
MLDKPVWKLEPRGEFSAKSAWDYARRRRDPSNTYMNIWIKGLPFKVSFFMWKVWKNKLPLDDFFKRLGYLMASKCWCCVLPQEETMTHLFFTSHAARKVWNYFLTVAGINVDRLTFHQATVRCWTLQTVPRLKPIIQAVPSIVVWELWKRRNGYKYGNPASINRVIYQI